MKRNLMHFLLSALLCVGSLAAYAQNVKVRGQLVDASWSMPRRANRSLEPVS